MAAVARHVPLERVALHLHDTYGRALANVAPTQTEYRLAVLEPSLVKALTGDGDEVSAAALASLASFGSAAAVEPLGRIVAGDAAEELKAAACGAVAAILGRTGEGASEGVVGVLKNTLAGDVQALKEAAAEALAAAGLSAEDILALVRAEGLGQK